MVSLMNKPDTPHLTIHPLTQLDHAVIKDTISSSLPYYYLMDSEIGEAGADGVFDDCMVELSEGVNREMRGIWFVICPTPYAL
jgi:hypothetical protein